MNPARDARLMLMMARRRDSTLPALRAGLAARASAWRDRIGKDASLMLAVRDEAAEDADPDAGHDAVLQIVAEESVTLPRRAAQLRDDLATLIDPARSALAIGTGHVISPRRGTKLFALFGRRDARIDAVAMLCWWRDDHAPLALRLLGSTGFGYVQIHVDHALSVETADILGIAAHDWDMVDSIEVDDVAAFLAVATDPGVAAELAADEESHIDRASLRGGFFDLLPANRGDHAYGEGFKHG